MDVITSVGGGATLGVHSASEGANVACAIGLGNACFYRFYRFALCLDGKERAGIWR
jgi:hypothetical protein